ncbi:uncharacterized protein GIQ15_06798 [Arthroderma uncinatum]|uniref:uncharacterized protein n=1 Tax=Arthroderma uncinatum TaxID=74035 RepID=UPI00144AF7CE|nr:uncharacterized protein GIQ15_06798 [Arthroderma uncinatum]KAF3479822.1 hypothetical protein GIQ15_06798 [Arthroderma uncinatum]
MAPSLRPLPANPPRHSSRPLRLTSARVKTYREDSSDSDEVYGSDGSPAAVRRRPLIYPELRPSEEPQPEQTSPQSSKPLAARITRSSSNRKKRALFVQASRKALTTSPKQLKPEGDADLEMIPLIDSGNIPPWQTLPYHVLFGIFLGAAPMGEGTNTAETWKSVRWLLAVSRLCRSFFEPAVAALYYSPPTFSLARLEGMGALLTLDQSKLATNYRNKVKCLDVHGDTSNVDGPSLRRLLYVTPQLKHLRIRDPSDTPRKLSKPFLFSFLENWFDWMPAEHIQLHSWEWSARVQLSRLKDFHLHPMFQLLRALRFYKLWPYEPPETQRSLDGERQPSPAQHLASSLAALPNLSVLEFSKCVLPVDFLFMLPVDLRVLSLDQCEGVDSESLASFLLEHGRKLEVLNLAHNKEIDMSFTVGLRASCPLLRVFRMDLNFSSGYTLAHDVEPHFELLLHPGQVPTWPTNLETLELERLRKWDITTAEAVFKSLIEAAPRLKYLRTLTLTAILKTDWRDRAQFREEWVRTLERTFLRRSALPSSVSNGSSKPPVQERTPSPRAAASDSSRLAQDGATEDKVPKRKSRRLAERRSPKDSDDSERSSDHGTPSGYLSSRNTMASPTREQQHPGATEQGMCNVVKIRIDNLRPADTILPAENLSDHEISGDDDWDGDDFDINDAW